MSDGPTPRSRAFIKICAFDKLTRFLQLILQGLLITETELDPVCETTRVDAEKECGEAEEEEAKHRALAEMAKHKLVKLKATPEWHEWEQLHPTKPRSP